MITAPAIALTKRQHEVLKFVREYRARTGVSPTMEEIGAAIGTTKIGAFHHVDALVRKGALIRSSVRHGARALVPVEEIASAPQPLPSEVDDFVATLFVSGSGAVASRLVLTSNDGRDLGGWCREAVRDRVLEWLATRVRESHAKGGTSGG